VVVVVVVGGTVLVVGLVVEGAEDAAPHAPKTRPPRSNPTASESFIRPHIRRLSHNANRNGICQVVLNLIAGAPPTPDEMLTTVVGSSR
jgi:hypothetical protein